jgi:hypothetical protein
MRKRRNARKGVHKRPHSLARWVGGSAALQTLVACMVWVGGWEVNRSSMHSHLVNPRHKSSIVRQCCCQLGGDQAHRQRVAQRASTQDHKYVPRWPCRLRAQESARGGCDESRMSSYTLANELHTDVSKGGLHGQVVYDASRRDRQHTHTHATNPTRMVKRNLQPTSQKSACLNRRVGHCGAGGNSGSVDCIDLARVRYDFQHSTSLEREGGDGWGSHSPRAVRCQTRHQQPRRTR